LSPWLGTASDGASSAATSEKRVNLWPFFLFMVTIGLLIESVLGTRRSVLVRLWRIITRREVADLSTDESNPAS